MDEDQLLRALRDSNLPKFLNEGTAVFVVCCLPFIATSHHSVADIVLFNGIVTDLFPGLEAPSVDYGLLPSFMRRPRDQIDRSSWVIPPRVCVRRESHRPPRSLLTLLPARSTKRRTETGLFSFSFEFTSKVFLKSPSILFVNISFATSASCLCL
jgi:hypothetical protein